MRGEIDDLCDDARWRWDYKLQGEVRSVSLIPIANALNNLSFPKKLLDLERQVFASSLSIENILSFQM